MKTLVLAIGGNALLGFGDKPTFEVQYANAARLARSLRPLLRRKELGIVITHGNGPQVGDELLRNGFAEKEIPGMPLHVLTAETQAIIGTMLEMALMHELYKMGTKREVVVVLSHVRVDRRDIAFDEPTKPIGPFYTKAQLEDALKRGRFRFVEERGRYRRVVASPAPLEVVELEAIRALAAEKAIVIAAGGGGIPVVAERGACRGVDAVIDKDATSQLLASSLGADTLAILTNIDLVYRDYKRKAGPIRRIAAGKLNLSAFEEGTMRPKLRACTEFVRRGGKRAFIGNLFKISAILEGTSGTEVVR